MKFKKNIHNQVYVGSAVSIMSEMPNSYVNMTLTSPPYDDLRSYGCDKFEYAPIIDELYRITVDGGVVVWVVADMIDDGSETGTSFRQALRFMDRGFKLHDTMIYQKQNPIPRKQRRYCQEFEYMFVFTKGDPTVFNPIMEESKYAGVKSTGKYYENPETTKPFRTNKEEKTIAKTKVKGNVWKYWVGNNTFLNKIPHTSGSNTEHPAKMPILLAIDQIESWTNESDLVFDPMCGSGTTLVAANFLNRKYIGIDVLASYVSAAKKRLRLSAKEFNTLRELRI